MLVGLTGHRHLGTPEDVLWTHDALLEHIKEPWFTSGITIGSIGADQIFAQLLRDQGKPYTAVTPCCNYESTFSADELPDYQSFLEQASDIIALDYPCPNPEAFFAGGKVVVESSDLMLAVWHGLPGRGRGGTVAIVAHCRSVGMPLIQINPRTREVQTLIAAQ